MCPVTSRPTPRSLPEEGHCPQMGLQECPQTGRLPKAHSEDWLSARPASLTMENSSVTRTAELQRLLFA